MAPTRRLVVDVLKPHDPALDVFTEQLGDLDTVAGVTATLVELDQEVQNVKLTFEGEALSAGDIETAIEDHGASVHSIDQVACGERIVQDRRTLQD